MNNKYELEFIFANENEYFHVIMYDLPSEGTRGQKATKISFHTYNFLISDPHIRKFETKKTDVFVLGYDKNKISMFGLIGDLIATITYPNNKEHFIHNELDIRI